MMTGRARLLAAVACVALIAAIASAILLTRESDVPQAGVPVEMSVGDLRETAAKTDRPIYWAGTRPGTRFELTRTRRGKSFVRYLPGGVEAGDKRPAFLTVATYPQRHSYSVAHKFSRKAAMVRAPIPERGARDVESQAAQQRLPGLPRHGPADRGLQPPRRGRAQAGPRRRCRAGRRGVRNGARAAIPPGAR